MSDLTDTQLDTLINENVFGIPKDMKVYCPWGTDTPICLDGKWANIPYPQPTKNAQVSDTVLEVLVKNGYRYKIEVFKDNPNVCVDIYKDGKAWLAFHPRKLRAIAECVAWALGVA